MQARAARVGDDPGRSCAAASGRGLRSLAARSYGNEPVVRRRGAAIRILSPYGELLAGVRTRARVLLMSFGGGPVPMRPAQAAAGRLVLAAGPDALGALRDTLPPRATKALEGARRLVAVMPLPGDATRFLASPSKG